MSTAKSVVALTATFRRILNVSLPIASVRKTSLKSEFHSQVPVFFTVQVLVNASPASILVPSGMVSVMTAEL